MVLMRTGFVFQRNYRFCNDRALLVLQYDVLRILLGSQSGEFSAQQLERFRIISAKHISAMYLARFSEGIGQIT